MIRYRLICRVNHIFDDWFSSSADFDTRQELGTLVCPLCGDTHIQKTLMAPHIGHAGTVSGTPPCEGGSDTRGCCGGGCSMVEQNE